MTAYPAKIDIVSGEVHVTFRDFPGVKVWGGSPKKAIAKAAEALMLHIENVKASGGPLQTPTDVRDDELMIEPASYYHAQ